MPSNDSDPISVALALHDAERLRCLAASASTTEARMLLRLLSDMIEREARLRLEKCARGQRQLPASLRSAAA